MKIIELRAENTKILKTVRIRPDGNTVVIGGEEAQGKSTVLDCIEMALRGTRKMAAVPIRTGQTEGSISLDLGDLKIERTFSLAKGTSLTVRGADGKKIPGGPQEILNKLYTALAFNPLAFADQKPEDQAETLRKLVGVDFAPMDAQIAKIESERLMVGRDSKNAAGFLDGIPEAPAGTPDEEVSVSALLEEKAKADKINEAAKRAQDEVNMGQSHVQTAQVEVTKAEEDLRKATRALDTAKLKLEEMKSAASALSDVASQSPTVDVSPIVEKMRNAETINRAVRSKSDRAKKAAEVAALKSKYRDMTDQIEAIEKQKTDMLAKVKWPIDGLGFSANGVVYQGLPFEQASKGQRYRVSIAVGMALNPELRVMLLPDAAVLSKSAMQAVEEMAKDKDYQVWIERVGDGDAGAIIMVDGEVQGA